MRLGVRLQAFGVDAAAAELRIYFPFPNNSGAKFGDGVGTKVNSVPRRDCLEGSEAIYARAMLQMMSGSYMYCGETTLGVCGTFSGSRPGCKV